MRSALVSEDKRSVNGKMNEESSESSGPQELIKSFNCFLVQKVSHNGTLRLYRDHLEFFYANGEEAKEAHTLYSTITDMAVESRLARKLNNLEIHAGEKSVVVSGLTEALVVKELIALMQNEAKLAAPTMGFYLNEETRVKFEELGNPNLICSYTIGVSAKTLVEYLMSVEACEKILRKLGCEDVVVGEWKELNGFKQRVLKYNKCVVLPVLGKNVYPVTETQKMFELENRSVMRVEVDWGNVPYADAFTPYVHVYVSSNDEAADFMVKNELVWKSNPFVKSIVQAKTIEETREQYAALYKQIQMDLLGKEVASGEPDKPAVEVDEFARARKIYKIIIIVLILLCTGVIVIMNWPRDGLALDASRLYTLVVVLFFFYVMMYF